MTNNKSFYINYLFPEEFDLLNSSQEMYFNNERKCYKYHYTKIDAVKSILSNKNIRLYYYKYLNDISESKVLFDYVLAQKKYCSVIETLKQLYISAVENLYLASFSIFGNRLSLWRGYGNVCIGFDFEKIKDNLHFIEDASAKQLSTSGFLIKRCNYIDTSDIAEMDLISETLVNNFKYVPSNIHSRTEFQYYSLTLGSLLFSYKHIGFHEEHEYRIFRYLWNANPFNDNGKSYLKFYFEPECVRKIVIGPSVNQDEIYEELLIFLSNSVYSKVEIYKSTIPFISK